jgi:hypothetical protein
VSAETTILPDAVFMRLRTAGNILSNIAFNLGQPACVGKPLTARHVESMRDARIEWDAAREAVHQAINAKSMAPPK